jgi:NADH dehydrogenase
VILVTGGSGFVGSSVVHALRTEERPVRALVRAPRKAGRLAAWGCELVQGDMTDAASLRSAAAGCEAIVHLVGVITGKPSDFERIMIEGTRSLVAAAKEAGVDHFVLMSALGASEHSKDLVPYYGAKWENEREVKGSGIPYTIFRPSFVFGRQGGILPMLIRQVRYLPVTPVVGRGERRSQPIWVDDVAQFFARSLRSPTARGRTFDLGGPDRPSWNELLDAIARALGKRRRQAHVPVGFVRAGAALVEKLPSPPVTRDQLTMLEFEDNVGDPEPAIEALGVKPITLQEQLRRAV